MNAFAEDRSRNGSVERCAPVPIASISGRTGDSSAASSRHLPRPDCLRSVVSRMFCKLESWPLYSRSSGRMSGIVAWKVGVKAAEAAG
jgi:hypothetical protein